MRVSDSRSVKVWWVLRQPVKAGGFGLRSNLETSPAAFIGGLEQALPHFTGERGVCQQLAGVLGDWTGQEERRWELQGAWEILQREALQCSAFLGQDLDGHLAAEVEIVGGGSVDGSTRKAIVQQREELRGAVLKEALAKMDNSTL